jgi:site-specific DNA-cytosine methylase
MPCDVHGISCAIPSVDLDVSGLPCVDFGPSGLQRGVEGPSIMVFLSWSKYHRSMKTKLLFLENVPELPIMFILVLMSDLYYVYWFYIDPADVQFENLSRMRLLVWMILKGFLVAVESLILCLCVCCCNLYVVAFCVCFAVPNPERGSGALTHDVYDVLQCVVDTLKEARHAVSDKLPLRACLLASADELRQEELQLAKARDIKEYNAKKKQRLQLRNSNVNNSSNNSNNNNDDDDDHDDDDDDENNKHNK